MNLDEGSVFQVGGAIKQGKLYGHRPADVELPQALAEGHLCYVLAPRQIGKSSLKRQTITVLRDNHGVRSVDIDITAFGTEVPNHDAWYFGLVDEIVDQLDLDTDPEAFWENKAQLTPVHRWLRFLRHALLEEVEAPIVIFIDEIDSTLALPISTDDFFASIRSTNNQRAGDPTWERLTFCLLGVATPTELMSDPQRTPFNIGRRIDLRDFTKAEASYLLPALTRISETPTLLLEQILEWTAGHPYLTQMICQILTRRRSAGDPAQQVRDIVDETFFTAGAPLEINLQTAKDRLLRAGTSTPRLLALYRRVLVHEGITLDELDTLQQELLLTGMVAIRLNGEGAKLHTRNQIFAKSLNLEWVKEQEARRPLAAALDRWLGSGRSDDVVPRGDALAELRAWARGREDLTSEENALLRHGVELEEAARRQELWISRLVGKLSALAALVAVVMGITVFLQMKKVEELRELARRDEAVARLQEERARESQFKAEKSSQKDRELREQLEIAYRLSSANEKAANTARLDAEKERIAAENQTQIALQREQETRAERLVAEQALAAEADARRVAAKILSQTDIYSAGLLIESDRADQGLAYLSRAAQVDSDHIEARSMIIDQLLQSNWPRIQVLTKEQRVKSVHFGKDNKALVSLYYDATFDTNILWNIGSGTADWEMVTEKSSTSSLSPDGRHLAIALPGRIKILDAKTGSVVSEALLHESRTEVRCPPQRRMPRPLLAPPRRGPGHLRPCRKVTIRPSINTVAFDPTGKYILSASTDHTARLWEFSESIAPSRIFLHDNNVSFSTFSPNGKYVLTISGQKVRIWKTSTGIELLSLKHDNHPKTAAFSPKEHHIFTVSENVNVWDLKGNRVDFLAPFTTRPLSVSFSKDGVFLLSKNMNSASLQLANTGHPIFQDLVHEDITHTDFSADGLYVLTVSERKALVWSTVTGRQIGGRSWLHEEQKIRGAAFSQTSDEVYTVLSDGRFSAWPIKPYQVIAQSLLREGGSMAVFSLNGKKAVTVSGSEVRVVDTANGNTSGKVIAHDSQIIRASFDSTGKRLVTAASNGEAQIWNATRGTPSGESFKHDHPLHFAILSPNDQILATAPDDKTLRLWDVKKRRELTNPLVHTSSVRLAIFHPSGASLFTVNQNGKLSLWDPRTGQKIFALDHENIDFALFSHDGMRIFAALRQSEIQILDARTGRAITSYKGFGGDQLLAFSNDGRRVITQSSASVRVRDVRTARVLNEFPQDSIHTAVFHPEGTRVLIASAKGVKIWDVPIGTAAEASDLADLAEAVAATAIDKFSNPVPLDDVPERFADLRRRAAEAPADSVTWRFIRWYLDDPWTRTISPYSAITVPEWIAERLAAGDRREAEEAFPGHPRLISQSGSSK